MKIACCVPTLDRASSLMKSVESLFNAFKNTNNVELSVYIIDQSDVRDDRCMVFNQSGFNVHYEYTGKVGGLVAAKQVFVSLVQHKLYDAYFFLEDDIILEHAALQEMACLMQLEPECLVVIARVPQNYSRSKIFLCFHKFFHQGIFDDDRQRTMYSSEVNQKNYRVKNFSGGVTLVRSTVFDVVNFRKSSKFHMLEDLDFSALVREHCSGYFMVCYKAVINHYSESIAKASIGKQFIRHLQELLLFRKLHGRNNIFTFFHFSLNFVWILVKYSRLWARSK